MNTMCKRHSSGRDRQTDRQTEWDEWLIVRDVLRLLVSMRITSVVQWRGSSRISTSPRLDGWLTAHNAWWWTDCSPACTSYWQLPPVTHFLVVSHSNSYSYTPRPFSLMQSVYFVRLLVCEWLMKRRMLFTLSQIIVLHRLLISSSVCLGSSRQCEYSVGLWQA